MGAHLNAYTSREQTAYFAHLFSKDLPWATALLADILQNPLLDNHLIDCERSVILREQEEVERQMEEVIFDHLHSIAYQGSSLGLTILGTSKDISKNINRASLKKYISSNYIPTRMVLCASGNVDHSLLVKEAEKCFFVNTPKAIAKPTIEDAKFVGSELRIHDDTMELAHMVIAVEGPSWESADFFPLMIAQTIVGSWNRGLAGHGSSLSSKLAQSCAKNSLALSFTSFMTSYKETGLWGIYMVSDHLSGLDDLCYEVQQEWVRICLSVGEGEVERAKKQLKSALLLSLDSTNAIAEDIGRQILIYGNGNRLRWKEIFDKIDACSLDTIKKAASHYLYDRDPAVVAMGPIATFPDYNRIRAATLWLRN